MPTGYAFERILMIIQIYEIQTPGEAEAMIDIGVDQQLVESVRRAETFLSAKPGLAQQDEQ